MRDREPEIEREYFALKKHFVNANTAPEIIGEDRLPWNNNYFIGNDPSKWRTDVPNYSKIRLKDVYDGIDLVYYGNKNRIKYDFIVQSGEDPSKIVLSYDLGENTGNASLSLNDNGELVVFTPLWDIIERKPYCFQVIDGRKIAIDIVYSITDESIFTFHIGDYNPSYPLVIDPELVYSTFLGGSAWDDCRVISVDTNECAYVAGSTSSSNYPTTSGAFDESYNGSGDNVFVSKLNSEGSALVYSTFLGGSSGDESRGISIDINGCVYVTGTTWSSDYPVTPSTFDESRNGYIDVFVSKLNAEGSALEYSTFLGGKDDDWGNDISVDTNGCAYVTGTTESSDYPVTQDAFDKIFTSGPAIEREIFISKLNSTGNILQYSTFLGGSDLDFGFDISVDTNECVYVTGLTNSSYYPITSGAFDESFNGGSDVVISKFSFEVVGNVTENQPSEFKLNPPYPNPFNAMTTIKYEIPEDCHVELLIYDILGRKTAVLKNDRMLAGIHKAVWNGKNDDGISVGSGVYLYHFKANKYSKIGKMLLIR